MNILIVGNGGRERAIEKFLGQSENKNLKIEIVSQVEQKDLNGIKEKYKLVIIGPEAPLVAGLADQLRALGIPTFGPDKNSAKLEGSKVFSKEFMVENGVQTSAYTVVKSVADLKKALHGQTEFLNRQTSFMLQPPYVLKADGLAGGKGVFICDNENDLCERGADIFERKTLGAAGDQALLEEFKAGYELSVLLVTNGKSYEILPIAQDHKRLKDGNKGPNTGGMGTLAPMNCDRELLEKIRTKVIEPTLRGIEKQGWIYRGVLFIGLMIQDGEPYTLEYNTRFGDPETQVILPLIQNDPLHFFQEIAQGNLPKLELHENRHACCIVLAAENYPEHPVKGSEISGLDEHGQPLGSNTQSYTLHAGTRSEKGKFFTNGGRVLNVVGIGQNRELARKNAYELIGKIHWNGMQYRNDIGLHSIEE